MVDRLANANMGGIPINMIESIKHYVNEGRELGGFLKAVFKNDFADAVCRADMQNLGLIQYYGLFLKNDCPNECWGSEEAYQQWIAHHKKLEPKYGWIVTGLCSPEHEPPHSVTMQIIFSDIRDAREAIVAELGEIFGPDDNDPTNYIEDGLEENYLSSTEVAFTYGDYVFKATRAQLPTKED